MKKLITIIFLIFGVLITACQQTPLLELPENFRRMEITNSIDSSTLIMFIQIENPNPFNVEITTINYNLFIDERPANQGILNNPIPLAPHQTKNISLPLWIPYSQLDKVTKSVLENKIRTADYTLSGEMVYRKNDEEIKQKFVISNKK
jgi:LEA14-like dessication related protein